MRLNRLSKITRHLGSFHSASQPSISGLSSFYVQKSARLWHDWIKDSLVSYCNTTSLHGFQYITRSGISHAERIFWVCIVFIAIVVSIVLVLVSWSWNEETPTVTVIETSNYPTWNLPFPAITICNFNKISKSKALQLAKQFKRPENMSETEMAMNFRKIMYHNFGQTTTYDEFKLLDDILEMNNYTADMLLNELTPNCIDMIRKCMWKGTPSRCDSLFQKINSTEGLCCSFNYFGLAKNNFLEKLAYQIPKQPYRVTGCGYPTGLTVLLDPIIEDYFGTYLSSFGFRLLIHNSYDFPDENAESKVLTAAREIFVRVSPESTYATQDVKNLPIDIRKCLFQDERKLGVMQKYSYINCLSECRVRTIYERCGCVPSNMPNNGSYPTCTYRQIYCVTQNKDVFIAAIPTLNDSIIQKNEITKSFPCDCIPDCELNQYPAEITMGKMNLEFTNTNINMLKGLTLNDEILLHVYFSDLMSTRYRKNSYQNWLETLSSLGGLLGLIMGFSIVTAFEFVYYLTLRPIFNKFFSKEK